MKLNAKLASRIQKVQDRFYQANAKEKKEDEWSIGVTALEPNSAARLTSYSNASHSNEDIDEAKKTIAGAYVKFYNYEDLKKRLDIQNYKDKLRQKLNAKYTKQRQHDMEDSLDINFQINPELVLNLNKLEQDSLLPKRLQGQPEGGFYRLRNVAIRDRVDKFFAKPAVYMQPHKNALAEIELRKGYFKPKVMLGSLLKKNTQFTTDL